MDQHIPLDCIGVFGVLIFLSMFAGLFLSAPVGGCCHCGVPVEVKVYSHCLCSLGASCQHYHRHTSRQRASSPLQPHLQLCTNFRMFLISLFVFFSYRCCSCGGLLALKPSLLIISDTAPTPSAVSSLHFGNLSRKRRWESKADGDLAVGWRQGRCAVLKMAPVKRCDAEGEAHEFPPSHAAVACLKTLSHALDTLGRQRKCGPASLSSWVRRYVGAGSQVWLLR